jgi:hypothetical protein
MNLKEEIQGYLPPGYSVAVNEIERGQLHVPVAYRGRTYSLTISPESIRPKWKVNPRQIAANAVAFIEEDVA